MIHEFDTIAAISTAVANAGIGIIRISGPDAIPVFQNLFEPLSGKKEKRKDKIIFEYEDRRIYYGHVKDGDEIIDECISFVMRAPKSYTREDVVEIDCHGGISVCKRIFDLIISRGIRPAEPGEFTKRAFLNGRIDLSQAEAVMDLIESKNETARKNSLSLLKGKLSEKIRKIREEILYQVAYIESALDDPEHISLEGYPKTLLHEADSWYDAVKKMLDSYDNGRMISEGIRTCIAGKPNAGKSSLLNALLGEERAIVTEVEGTTRDTLEEILTIDGITLHIIDTAGIRDTEDRVEKIGVEKAKEAMDRADLILFVIDSSRPLSKEDEDIFSEVRGKKKIVLLNKSDMEAVTEEGDIRPYMEKEDRLVRVSARYHYGMEDFIEELKDMMFHGELEGGQDIFINSARHKKLLADAFDSLSCLKDSICSGMPEDFFTIDMMDAYESLGMIIGESVEEDLIDEIFSRFCTGK